MKLMISSLVTLVAAVAFANPTAHTTTTTTTEKHGHEAAAPAMAEKTTTTTEHKVDCKDKKNAKMEECKKATK